MEFTLAKKISFQEVKNQINWDLTIKSIYQQDFAEQKASYGMKFTVVPCIFLLGISLVYSMTYHEDVDYILLMQIVSILAK